MTKQLSLRDVRNCLKKIIKDKDIGDISRIGNATFYQAEQQKFYVQRKTGPDLIAVFFSDSKDAFREAAVHKYLYNLGEEGTVPQFCASKIIYSDPGLIVRHYFEGDPLNVLDADRKLLSRIALLLVEFRRAPLDKFHPYKFDFEQLLVEAKAKVPDAKRAFRKFERCERVFDLFSEIIFRGWQTRLKNLSPGLMHGDLHPKNIVVSGHRFSLVDFSYSSYFYPLYDLASFLVQFTHEYRLTYLGKDAQLDKDGLENKRRIFLNTYKKEDPNFDPEILDLFKILLVFRGLEYSTAGFRKCAQSVRKHILFELFCSEVLTFGTDGVGLAE